MPAQIDWNALLFGSPAPDSTQGADSTTKLGSEQFTEPDQVIEFAPEPEPENDPVQVIESSQGIDIANVDDPVQAINPTQVASPPLLHTTKANLDASTIIPWNLEYLESVSLEHQITAVAVFLGTALLWFWLSRRKRNSAAARQLIDHDEALNAVKSDYTDRIETLEQQLDERLKNRVEALEEQFKQAVHEQSEKIEDHVRKSFNKRVETLEYRIKLDQEALEDVHRALSERMEAFETYVRSVDAKQLDQEAVDIAQRAIGQRLNTVEEDLRNLDNKTRASSQRVEALDDSVRVMDSRAKSLSQRVEAAEDNLNSTDGQVTLLSHDVNRGSSVIEKLQRTVKMLPDAEKFKGLSRTWEAKIKRLEAKLDETEKALEEHLAEPPSQDSLTWSHIEAQEIEPCGPIYTRPYALSLDGSTVSPSSSSVRSHSTSGSHYRSYSTASSSPAMHQSMILPMSPMTPERKRLDTAGFRETTFSSRQKLSLSRGESWS
ncbi:hypothetical protein F5Y18DRAFT_414415 [Xylariaceae sp. FL1019]|nr:hypothetical protein F5Y18DRAFT_414415 [Xylariaceae sp. FL1019]